MNKTIAVSDFRDKLNKMSDEEIEALLKIYNCEQQPSEISCDDELQAHLLSLGINSNCPHCNSDAIVRYGSNGSIRRYKCKSCNKTFTLFTGTILEKSKYGWDIWVNVLQMVLNHVKIEHIHKTLIKDKGLAGLNYKSVFLWVRKLIHAMAAMPMPKLTGVVQIDETFFRESQKGSRKLVSYVKNEKRLPRRGRIPSKMGTMGNEFANVVCMVDSRGYAVTRFACLGKLTLETFSNLFDEYIENPSFICTDANSIYQLYTDEKQYSHYVKPSNYLKIIRNHGYLEIDRSDPILLRKQEIRNQQILKDLYEKELIDYIDFPKSMEYLQFNMIKVANGLNLARVNQFHSDLKLYVEKNTKGVSTKYLEDYVGFYTFLRNWKTSNGDYPTSKKEAEQILIDILKGKTTYTVNDLHTGLNVPKASGKYMAILQKKTDAARAVVGNEYFKFDEEDGVASFNKRDFLESLPKHTLSKLRSKYKIDKNWTKRSVINALLQKDGIQEDIFRLISENKAIEVTHEDELAIKDRLYVLEKRGA